MSDERPTRPPYATPLHSDDRKIIRKIERDPWNRLRSIKEDADWVRQVSKVLEAHATPVIPNLRCGAWYAPRTVPQAAADTYCYFKSTDGHAGEWGFSLKRPNIAVVQLIQERGSVVIADSTRRGKSMPDALSKTIPIWCAVMTEASRRKYDSPDHTQAYPLQAPFREVHDMGTSLFTPSHQVPHSEHAQIQERVHSWVNALLASALPVPKLDKPLVPFFLTRSSSVEEEQTSLCSLKSLHDAFDTVHPVVLLSASRRVDLPQPSADGSYYYTQGSGDDEEIWSNGLTSDLFWSADHHATLMAASSAELPSAIASVVDGAKGSKPHDSNDDRTASPQDVQIGESIFHVGRRSEAVSPEDAEHYGLVVLCDILDESIQGNPALHSADLFHRYHTDEGHRILRMGVGEGKAGLNMFKLALSVVIAAVRRRLFVDDDDDVSNHAPAPRVLIASTQGSTSDTVIAMVVACLTVFYGGAAGPTPSELIRSGALYDAHCQALTKEDIRKRLQWVVATLPEANPSRKHMQRVNAVLLSSPSVQQE